MNFFNKPNSQKSAVQISDWLARNLLSVQKPGRYVGGELNQIQKDWDACPIHIALAFPDIYDIGLPNLGLAILYDEINRNKDALAERVYLPWLDMEAAMRKARIPLFSLESQHPVNEFDILGISLPYESLFTNTLNLMDLSGIPVRSKDRTELNPIVIAGGNAASNPEPMADFIDAFVIGEGEGFFTDFISMIVSKYQRKLSKTEILSALSGLSGVYIPTFYKPRYFFNGKIKGLQKLEEKASVLIKKRLVSVLPPPPTNFLVPSISVVHNRVSIEIMRGCSRGCRFCHAGMINRPIRERAVEQVLEAIDLAIDKTGYEEVALLSLSSSDFSQIIPLVDEIKNKYQDKHLTISLPSLRIESLSIQLLDGLKGSRQGSFTLAPEAATESMRNRINKPISSESLLSVAREIFQRGWLSVKLYFMIGLPQESLQDVSAIADLCKSVLAIGKEIHGNRANVHAGISTFVPKPHTPFQWHGLDSIDIIQQKINLLKAQTRLPGLRMSWTDPYVSLMEAFLSRGDRRLARVIYRAWKHGAKFDAWQDQFNYQIWERAFMDEKLDPSFYANTQRELDEILPWDHITLGVNKKYLSSEFQRSRKRKTQLDCREQCSACGILPLFSSLRAESSSVNWKCPVNETEPE